MRKLLLLALLAALPVFAADEMMATDGKNVVTLLNTPCVNEKAASLLPRLNVILLRAGREPVEEKDLRAGRLLYEGKFYITCWTRVEDAVLIMDEAAEETSLFPIPAGAFRKVDVI